MAQELNFQIPREGYDSYLYGIIPDDQAVLAGAFSISMQQIKNIDKINIEDFAKVAYNMESTIGLPLTAGTDIPTDLPLSTAAKIKTALGSGVYGTYTTSNFFGAMTGLPYPWVQLYTKIQELETQTLYDIYQNLYLAVTWEKASATYNGVSFTYTNRGGGYGRDNSGPPNVTVNGNAATAVIGTDPNNLETFGKLVEIIYTGSAGPVVIDSPIGIDYAVDNIGYNNIIQNYIDAANNEIQNISTSSAENFQNSKILNTLWNITGIALKHEQRARYNGIGPVSVPYDDRLSNYPTSFYAFVDSIPDFAKKIEPHMTAQTLEHISDLTSPGGQSIVAMMRQERNQDRLAEIGIDLDNNLQSDLNDNLKKELIVNGVLCGAVEGIESENGCIYTIPAWPQNTEPYAYYDCTIDELRLITQTTTGSINPLLDGTECPIVNTTVPVGFGPVLAPENFISEDGNVPNFAITVPLPVELDTNYTGTTLFPSTYNIANAIDKVIECNCDCWIK